MTTEISSKLVDDEKQNQFNELMQDETKKPITHIITLEFTDFVDMQEFNSMQITAGEFKEKETEYFKEHSKHNEIDKLTCEFADKLEEIGLFKDNIGISIKSFDLCNLALKELSYMLKNVSQSKE